MSLHSVSSLCVSPFFSIRRKDVRDGTRDIAMMRITTHTRIKLVDWARMKLSLWVRDDRRPSVVILSIILMHYYGVNAGLGRYLAHRTPKIQDGD